MGVEGIIVACIPALNEERAIAGVVIRAKNYVDRVVVCDDGSVDMTGSIAEQLGASVIRHDRNQGYGASLRDLFKEARRIDAGAMVIIDGDGQHDPSEIPQLIERLGRNDVDIVIGSRFVDGGGSEAPGWRKAGIRVISGMVSNAGGKVNDAQSGFRAYNRRAIELLVPSDDGMGLSTELLLQAQEKGLKIAEVPIHVSYGPDTSSEHPLIHGLDVALSTFRHLSTRRPLLFYGVPGLFTLALAIVFWLWALELFATTGYVSTNIVLLALAGTFVGFTLLTTSIILWVVVSVVREKE